MKPRATYEYVEALQRISTESRRLAELTRQLLFLSRLERDMLKEECERFCLDDLLADLCQGNPRVCYKSDKGLMVNANGHLLGMALKNIIDNALKYSEREVEVTASVANGRPHVAILDNGIGIPADELANITQSFFRASNAMGKEGNCIGLSLTNKILQLYGFRLDITSKEGEYTKVGIAL